MNQAIAFIKNHKIALTCGLIALVAIGVLLFVIPGKLADVQASVDESTKQPYEKLSALAKKTRTLPVVTTAPAAEAQPLEGYPTQRMIDAGEDALNRLKEEAADSLKLVTVANERKPLVANALPEATPLARQNFFNAYRTVAAQNGPESESGIIRRILNGSLPPTPEELTFIANAREREIRATLSMRNAENVVTNQTAVDAAVSDMKSRLEMDQRIGRARTSKIYVDPKAVQVHPFLGQGVQSLDSSTIFNAQVSLWLQEIMFEALAEANAKATDVFDAPVKHLISLQVPLEIAAISTRTGGGFGSAAASDETAAPAELKPDATAPITPNYATSPFGYAHNSLYDAAPVSMTIRLDVRQLPQVLATLSHSRLITVTNVNVSTVDTGKALADKFIYDQDGKTPLVEARIDCEVLLLRTWLAPLMPTEVKAYFAKLSSPTPAG